MSAAIHFAQGQFPQAEPLLRRALSIREQALGPTHPDVATTLDHLGDLHRQQGQYAEAEPLLRRALSIREQALGPTHPDVATTLDRLGNLHREQDQYAEAEPLLRRALSIREQALGPTHPDVATSLNNVAAIHFAKDQYAQAEPLLQRALVIREQVLSPTHPAVANSLNNLAVLYDIQGQYAQAESLYRRALIIEEQARPDHPTVGLWLQNLAGLYSGQGNHTHAMHLLTRSSDIYEHSLALMLTLGAETQKLASVVTLRSNTDRILSLHIGFAPQDPQALRLALTTVLRRKGRVLDAMADTLATLRRHVQPEDQQLLAQWAAARGQLATLVFKGLRTMSPEAYRTQFAQLETQVQQLEAQLSARSAAFRMQTQPVTLEQVQAAIPEGAALVEMAVYTSVHLAPGLGSPHYVAYVLHRQGTPTWVDLGSASPIDQAVERFRADLSGPLRLRVKEAARVLDELVMRPIRPLLGAARHVFLAPDGVLNLVPFGALVDETQHYLLERYMVSYLTTGRDLLRPPSPRPALHPPLVVGNPTFNPPGLSP